jgi:hypothetical protein
MKYTNFLLSLYWPTLFIFPLSLQAKAQCSQREIINTANTPWTNQDVQLILNSIIKRSNFITFVLFIFGVNMFAQGRGTMSKDTCSSRNITFSTMGGLNPLLPYIVDEDRSGVIELHPFSISDIGGWQNFTDALRTDTNTTFINESNARSRLFDGVYYRFQQLYKGVPVEDGGFTILVQSDDPSFIVRPCPSCPGPSGPCDRIAMIAPNIYEDISLSVTPTISISNVQGALITAIQRDSIQVATVNLKVVNNLNRDCTYKLAYEVYYYDKLEGERVAWIDANTGVLYWQASQHNSKDAPTSEYMTQDMNDQLDGQNTVLQNARLTAHNMEDVLTFEDPLWGELPVTGVGQLRGSFSDNQIPTSPMVDDWTDMHAPVEVFQAFWLTDKVLTEYESQLGVVFEDVHIGIHPTAEGAVSFRPGQPNTRANFVFGRKGGNSIAEVDIIGHELAHAMIREFFESTQIEGGSLHEAIADMCGVYMEYLVPYWGFKDWEMGDNIPWVFRDLENTVLETYPIVEDLTEVHDRSEALGHWFFLCVNGDQTLNIPPMDIKEVLVLVLEALPNLGDNPDYPDLMRVVMDLTESEYGTCSDQFITILRSWEAIGVPTNHRMANPNAVCAVLESDHYTWCEEENMLTICLSPGTGLNLVYGRWAIIGKNSTSFQSHGVMVGNSQSGGACLEVTQIPTMPYYPQTMTIQYWHPGIGQILTMKIVIRDCDGLDPTCEDYYDLDDLAIPDGSSEYEDSALTEILEDYDSVLTEISEDYVDSIESIVDRIEVFDLTGQRIEIPEGQFQNFAFGIPQIVVVTYWNKAGELIQAKKVLLH